MRKILHYQQWCFSRIGQEKFQGNPGNLLVFFTVYIHISVSNLYIPRIDMPIWQKQNRQTDPVNI
jgi:hypothetical protein